MEKNKQYEWHKIAGSRDEIIFPESRLLAVQAGGKQVCLVKIKEELYACAAKCPHAGGIIANGFIDGLDNVVCPLHRYRFNLQNGRNISGEGYYLKTYPVRKTDEGIYIGIERSGLFFW